MKEANLNSKYLELIKDFNAPAYPQNFYNYKNSLLNKSIYKYYNFSNKHHLNSIKKNEFWLSNASKFNDPYDCSLNLNLEKMCINKLLQDEEIPTKLKAEIRANINNGNTSLEDIINNLSFTNIEKENCHQAIKKTQLKNASYSNKLTPKFREKFKITCFSECYNNLLMWSHYAKSHTGFCIEYDLTRLNDKHPFKKNLYPVIYTRTPLDLSYSYQSNMLDVVNILMASNKSIDWAYECEWRYLGTKDDPNNYKMPMTPKTIYLGINIESKNEDKINEIARSQNINVKKMKLKQSAFEMEATST